VAVALVSSTVSTQNNRSVRCTCGTSTDIQRLVMLVVMLIQPTLDCSTKKYYVVVISMLSMYRSRSFFCESRHCMRGRPSCQASRPRTQDDILNFVRT
jgi:hypothetical protein